MDGWINRWSVNEPEVPTDVERADERMNGRTEGRKDEQSDGPTDGRSDGRTTDGRTNLPTENQSNKVINYYRQNVASNRESSPLVTNSFPFYCSSAALQAADTLTEKSLQTVFLRLESVIWIRVEKYLDRDRPRKTFVRDLINHIVHRRTHYW